MKICGRPEWMLSAQILPSMVLSGGVDITDTQRDSSRREFQIVAPSSFAQLRVRMLRPDYLLSPSGDRLLRHRADRDDRDRSGLQPPSCAPRRLRASCRPSSTDGLELSVGARYEKGEQEVRPLQVFTTLTQLRRVDQPRERLCAAGGDADATSSSDDMQVRFNVVRRRSRARSSAS